MVLEFEKFLNNKPLVPVLLTDECPALTLNDRLAKIFDADGQAKTLLRDNYMNFQKQASFLARN